MCVLLANQLQLTAARPTEKQNAEPESHQEAFGYYC